MNRNNVSGIDTSIEILSSTDPNINMSVETCPICLEPLLDYATKRLICNHTFCTGCITNPAVNKCPLCRGPKISPGESEFRYYDPEWINTNLYDRIWHVYRKCEALRIFAFIISLYIDLLAFMIWRVFDVSCRNENDTHNYGSFFGFVPRAATIIKLIEALSMCRTAYHTVFAFQYLVQDAQVLGISRLHELWDTEMGRAAIGVASYGIRRLGSTIFGLIFYFGFCFVHYDYVHMNILITVRFGFFLIAVLWR